MTSMKNRNEFFSLVGISILVCIAGIAFNVINDQKYFYVLKHLIHAIFIGLSLVLVLVPIIKLIKKKSPLPALFISISTIVIASIALNYFGITSEKIAFSINKESYLEILRNSKPIKTKSGNEVTIVETVPKFQNAKRFLILDKNQEFINPENKYFGVNAMYARDRDGGRILSGYQAITIEKYSDNIYIADVCLYDC